MFFKGLKKAFSLITVFLLLFGQYTFPVLAQEATTSAQLNSQVVLDTSFESTASATVSPAVAVEPASLSVLDWDNGPGGIAITHENVRIDQLYKAPQNDKVTLKFNKLPSNPGKISIKEVPVNSLGDDNLNPVTDKAYDITSTMENGTFEYTLTLPTPKTEQVEVKASEDNQTFVTLGGVTAQTDTLTITGLNHFTIFVVTTVTDFNNGTSSGTTVTDVGGGDGSVTNALGSEIVDQLQTTGTTAETFDSAKWLAQTFTPAQNGMLTGLTLSLRKQNSDDGSGDVTVEIRNTSSGLPTASSPLATASVSPTSLPTAKGNVNFVFSSPAPVTTGTQYAIVVHRANTSDTDDYDWYRENSSTDYTGGGGYKSTNSGSTWPTNFGDDFIFTEKYKTYGTSGTQISEVKDTNSTSTIYSTLSWNESLAAGTDITFEVRASNTAFAKGDTSPSWVSLGSANSPIDLSSALPDTYQYFQWRATTSGTVNTTPTLQDVTVNYNRPPSFDAIANQTVNEDVGAQNITITNISPGPSDESDQTVILSATSNDASVVPNPTVSGSGATRTLTYTPVANSSGTATITVTATDSLDLFFSRTFDITVIPNGHVVIVKDAISNNAQDFTFHNNFGNGNPDTFQLDDDGSETNTLKKSQDSEVFPGNYAVSEDEVPGWKLSSAVCSDGSSVDAIDVSAGETVTCTFTNKELATIVLVKNTLGGDDTFDFEMSSQNLPASSSQITTLANSGSQTFTDIDPDDTYSISENVPEGWDLTSSSCTGTNTPDSITPNTGETITCTFTNTKRGSISGYKFIDTNGDGVWDRENEWEEDSWRITLSGGPNNDTTLESWTGDADTGQYLFENLLPGTYRVCEDIATSTDNFDGWTQTTPLNNPICPDGTNGYEITLSAGENSENNDFGNFKKITISGWKFEDMIADGSYNPNDPNHPDQRLSGWTIFIDGNSNGVFDEGEKSATTGEDGSYSLDNLRPGTYRVREASQSGWIQTTTNPSDIEAQSGNDVSGIDFGNFKKVIIDIFKWKDLNADGEWDKGELGIGGWDMRIEEAIKTLASTPNPVEGQPPVMTEEIIYGGLRILPTNDDGKASFEVDKPGTYRMTESTQDNFQRTHPQVDSFFDIFVEVGGQTTEGETSITKDKNDQPLRFGNAPFQQLSDAKFVPTSGDGSSTSSIVVLGDSTINVSVNGGTSSVSLPANTIITRTDGGLIDTSLLSAQNVTTGSLSGLGTGVVVDGAMQWGIPNLGLSFSSPITINIYVGTALNGQTLNVVRSSSTSSGWTSDGIVAPATCVVSNGLCIFQATKASYYATTHTGSTSTSTSSTSSSSGGDGGDGLGCAVHDCSVRSTSPQNQVLGVSIQPTAVGFASGVLGVSGENQQGNIGVGEQGQVQGEATESSQPAAQAQKKAGEGLPFNVKVVMVIVVLLLGGFVLFRLIIK